MADEIGEGVGLRGRRIGFGAGRDMKKIIYFARSDGHRISYGQTLADLLGFEVVHGPPSLTLMRSLAEADCVVCGTIDDHYFSFFLLSVWRRTLGKATVGLFLRPMQCFRTERPIVYTAKRVGFRILSALSKVSVISIIPHAVRPEIALVSNGWIADPQLWDYRFKGISHKKIRTDLSDRIEERREKGIGIVVYIGEVNRLKGFDELASIASEEEFKNRFLLVVAGVVAKDYKGVTKSLSDSGAIVVDRFVTDDEIASLYFVADFVWCRYSEDYDQASGVFGRAIQFGVRPIVRRGSVISDQFSSRFDDLGIVDDAGWYKAISERSSRKGVNGMADHEFIAMAMFAREVLQGSKIGKQLNGEK